MAGGPGIALPFGGHPQDPGVPPVRRRRVVRPPLHSRGRDVPESGGKEAPRREAGPSREDGGAAGARAVHRPVRRREPVRPGYAVHHRRRRHLREVHGDVLQPRGGCGGGVAGVFPGKVLLPQAGPRLPGDEAAVARPEGRGRRVFRDLLPAAVLVPLHRPQLRRGGDEDPFPRLLPWNRSGDSARRDDRHLLHRRAPKPPLQVPAAVRPAHRAYSGAGRPADRHLLHPRRREAPEAIPPGGTIRPGPPHPLERTGSHVISSGVYGSTMSGCFGRTRAANP